MYLISEALAQVGYFGVFFGFFSPYLFYLSYSFYSPHFSYGSCYIMYPIACKTRGKRRMSGSPGFKSVKEKGKRKRRTEPNGSELVDWAYFMISPHVVTQMFAALLCLSQFQIL
jgi:hypothetical protein